ncbi:prolyl aminopeptidase [Mycoplasmopsis ciconiae]|uniref:Proline iminopeptidase n=1 Tax=Mycoplasmopsis ciconiae TaxID=561067 RepID=A0ABU7ML58_9BACT|nr:prolyl aminopeptidase [Mycoplasmopsis ciconiae]
MKKYKNHKIIEERFIEVTHPHKIYVEVSGNPNGIPVIFVHGGPGAGSSEASRSFFDPEYYKIIRFDQRGCGKSTPYAELWENNTWELVEDIETIRKTFNLGKVILFGGSWGSTLSLVYAITYPENVSKLVLRGIFLCRPKDINYLYEGPVGEIYPELYDKYSDYIDPIKGSSNIEKYYKALVNGSNKDRIAAARHFTSIEKAASYMRTRLTKESNKDIYQMALLEAYYFYHNCFFETDNWILEKIDAIKDIPTWVVHGRFDNVCLPSAAWDLKKMKPNIDLRFVIAAHSAFEVNIADELTNIMDEIKLMKK